MQKNRILWSIIVLIGISLLTANLIYDDTKEEDTQTKQPSIMPNVVDSSVHTNDSFKHLIIKPTPQPTLELTIKKNELVFDSDPVVDSLIIIKNNRTCYRFFNFNKNPNTQQLFERGLDKNQLKYYQSHKKYCLNLNQQHPEYSLSDLSKIQKQKENASANSYWGQIIKGEIDPDSLNDFEISNLLKQNSLNILSQAPSVFENYFLKIVHWELENVLQSHQYDYVNHIRHYAHQLYLCELGEDCGSNSSIMATLCFLNSHSCGLNYTDYINDLLSAGQYSDIQLAMQYLQNKFQ